LHQLMNKMGINTIVLTICVVTFLTTTPVHGLLQNMLPPQSQHCQTESACQCQAELLESIATELQTLQSKVSGLESTLQQLAGCPDGWEAYVQSCFYYGVIPQSWADAQKTCERLGAHLATVTDADEEVFVRDMIGRKANYTGYFSGPHHGYIWLGGFDYLHEGQWVWVTGESFSYADWRDPNEAHNPAENCLDYSGGFNDNTCTHVYHFLCEKKSILRI
jgi:hypothetical protein